MWPPDPAARWRQSSWKDSLGWHRLFATEEGTSTDTKKGSSEPEQAFVCFARSTSGENLAKAAWRRSEREAPFSFLGLPLPGAAALGVGRILCKITRKRFDPSCHPEASQMLPRSDIPRIPARERTILGSATCLGPGSCCNCRSDPARQGNLARSPGGPVLGAP